MRFLHGVLWMLGVMVVILAVWTLGPELESKYFPVYSKIQILKAENKAEGVSLVIRFTKFRNCDPQGFAWFIGDFNAGARQLPVRGLFPQGTVHRPLGTQVSNPFYVEGLRVEDLQNLFAEIYHHCHPLWITRTVIYP